MKTLGRILIILIAALAVIGATYALSQTSAVLALVSQPMGEGSENGNRPARPDFANGQGAPAGEMRGDHDGGGGSWETVGRNLIQIAAIVAAVQVVWSIGRKIKRSAERHNRAAVGRSS
jgi:hypothetical protein